jgi:hypothetical protein
LAQFPKIAKDRQDRHVVAPAPSFLAQKREDRQDRQPKYMTIFKVLAILTPGDRTLVFGV